MTYKIIKISEQKKSVNGNSFTMVEFLDEDGKWSRTFICPSYNNYKNWEKFLKVGVKIKNLIKRDENMVDADSKPIMVQATLEQCPTNKEILF